MLYHLSYISVANQEFDRSQLSELAAESSKRNSELQISGALVFDGTHFFQYLEGEKENVELVYNKIKQDQRHRDVSTISESSIEKRVYPHWGMKSFLPSDFTLEDRVHILDLLCHKLSEKSVPEILMGLETPSIGA